MRKFLSLSSQLLILVVILLPACHDINHDGVQGSSKKNSVKSSKNTKKTKLHKTNSSERDSAPSGPIPTWFKPIKPKNEPLSRYGNPIAYNVNGKRYNVLTTASGYKTRGLASWYGTKFHSRRTSSGEDYDMYALTAAHKTLPLPTYVRIKNLKNGRTAIIKVNDRGPFHNGRVIDLSYGSAVKLGIFPAGTAPVEIEALSIKGAHVAHFYLQAGAFSSKQLAELLQHKLAKITPSPVFIDKQAGRYLVRVGPFADKSMTDKLKALLIRNGVKGSFSLLI